jgi:hypothetical protein
LEFPTPFLCGLNIKIYLLKIIFSESNILIRRYTPKLMYAILEQIVMMSPHVLNDIENKPDKH